MAFDESLLEPIDDFDESLLEPVESGAQPIPPIIPRSMEWEGPPLPETAKAPISPAPQVQYGYMGIPFVPGGQEKPLINVPSSIGKTALDIAMRQPAPNLSHLLWLLPEKTRKDVAEGLSEGGAEMLSGMTSPEATSSLGATVAAPELMVPAWKLYGLAQVPQAVKSVLQAENTKERTKASLNLAASLAMGLAPGGKKTKALKSTKELTPLVREASAITEKPVTPIDGVKDMLANPPEEGLSDKAFALGKQVKTLDEVKDLLRLREKSSKDALDAFEARMEEINKLPPEQREAAINSPKTTELHRKASMGTQIVNEALEKATGFNVTKNKPGETFPVPLTPEQFSKLEAEVKAETQPKAAAESAPETAPKEEAVTPAAPAEAENVHVQNAKQVDDMTSRTQFSIWSNQQREGASGAAQTVGWNAPTAEFRDYLKQQWDNSVAAQKDKTRSPSERGLSGNKAQFFREAYEVATGTGSAAPGSLFRRKNPSYKPPFPITETSGLRFLKIPDKEILDQAKTDTLSLPWVSRDILTSDARGVVVGSASNLDAYFDKSYHGSFSEKFGKQISEDPNKATEPIVIYNSYAKTRDLLRRKYGDKITLWRAELKGGGKLADWETTGKNTLFYASREGAKKYLDSNRELTAKSIPIDDIIAVHSPDGKYEEFIVLNHESKKLQWPPVGYTLRDGLLQPLTEKGPTYAAKEGQVEEGVQPERERTDAQRVPAEASARNRLQPATEVQAPGAQERPATPEVLLGGQVAAGIPDPVVTAKAATKIITDFVSSATPGLKTIAASLQGRAVPRTSSASTASGNALVRLASAKIAAPAMARSMATDVLGAHHKDTAFSQKLGAVLVEDRLRAIRSGLQQAGDPDSALVQSIIGQQWSPLKTEADYRAALTDPEIKAAIDRHKATVQQRAEEAHVMARGELAGVGQDTGAFVNLKAILPEAEAEVLTQGGRGNLENPLRRLSRFFREAKGTGQKYELDYRTLAERMIRGNFEEVAKRQLYDQLIKDGLAIETDPGVKPPEIGGKPSVGFTIERRGVPAGENQARTFIKKLWIRQDLAREFRQAEDLDGPVSRAGLVTAVNLINRIQLAGPTDAVWHTANMIGSIAGSQGGRTVLTDLARKLPGVNLADAIVRVTASGIRLMRDDPAIQRQMAELAELGAMRAPHDANFMGRFIQFIDRAGRLVRDDMYKNLVDRGAVTPSEATRREWINQMGQYNPRLMSQFQRFFKEFGFSPFVVAGRNFNRMAMRRLFMQPGIEAANKTEALKLRAIEAFGTFATLVVVPSLINYATTGSPSGRPGTKFGVIDTGKNDKDGNAIVIDPAQWTGLRRGMRISGVQAFIEGQRRGQSGKQIARTALRDELGGILHPWTGPPVTAAAVGATGYDPRFYKQSEDPSNPAENLKASLQQLNPIAKAIITSHEKDTPVLPKTLGEAGSKTGKAVAEIGKSFGGAVGIKPQKLATAKDQLTDLHQAWMRTNPNKKIQADYERRQKEQFVSDYKDLDTAMRKGDEAAAMRAITALLETKSPKDIAERMSPFYKESPAHVEGTKKPLFQESLATEGKFYRTLSDEQKKLYHQAQKDRIERYRQFLGYFRQVMSQRKPAQPQRPIPQPYA